MASTQKYWFPAKRYGWGWGLPSSWQGWAVTFVYVALVALSAFIFPPRMQPVAFVCGIALLTAAMIGVCWLKGEPPS
jgi:hypothetical protein